MPLERRLSLLKGWADGVPESDSYSCVDVKPFPDLHPLTIIVFHDMGVPGFTSSNESAAAVNILKCRGLIWFP
jgi:hypothetical protein